MRRYLRTTVPLLLLMAACLAFTPARRVTSSEALLTAAPVVAPTVVPSPSMSFEDHCQADPMAVLQGVLARHRMAVEGYRCTFVKREKINDKLRDREVIACESQESPFAVTCRWLEGKGRAEASLFVAGENDDQVLIVPSSPTAKGALRLLGKSYASRSPDSPEARDAARSPVTQFGMANALRRTLATWQAAKDRNELRVVYQGVVDVPELDGRRCHVFHRTTPTPEAEGVTQSFIYLDAETKLQVGTVIRAGDDLVAEYYYKNVELNPPFANDHFSAANFK